MTHATWRKDEKCPYLESSGNMAINLYRTKDKEVFSSRESALKYLYEHYEEAGR